MFVKTAAAAPGSRSPSNFHFGGHTTIYVTRPSTNNFKVATKKRNIITLHESAGKVLCPLFQVSKSISILVFSEDLMDQWIRQRDKQSECWPVVGMARIDQVTW